MFERFAHRSNKLEHLDTGDYTAEEYAKWLDEMKLINRWLGDAKALRLALEQEPSLATATSLSVLDIGAGSGELLRTAHEILDGKAGPVVGAELNTAAARAINERRSEFGVVGLLCNGLQLPFADHSFDIVMCSLLLHHLTDDKAVRLITEMDRVARRLLIVIDLFRDPLPYYLYRILSPLFLQRKSVEDGSLSILRSFRPNELKELARRAGVANANVRRAAFRLILTSSKQ